MYTSSPITIARIPVNGKRGVEPFAEILDVCTEMGFDIIYLQEIRRSGQSTLTSTREMYDVLPRECGDVRKKS